MKLVLWHLGIAGWDGDKVVLGGADHDPGQQVHEATPPSLLLELKRLLHSILQRQAIFQATSNVSYKVYYQASEAGDLLQGQGKESDCLCLEMSVTVGRA